MKLIGKGNTASVYEWEKGKVIKLYRHSYSPSAIDREFSNAKLMENGGFSFPKAIEQTEFEGEKAIVFDRVDGVVFLEVLLLSKELNINLLKMAKLHQRILDNVRSNAVSYKSFLSYYAHREQDDVLMKAIDQLPNGEFLCHGDFHPGNIMVSEDELYVIDFMNVCKGPKLYDIARTVYLTEYTPLPDELDHKDAVAVMRSSIVEGYLKELGVDRNDLIPFLKVIHHARQYECPHEFENGFHQIF